MTIVNALIAFDGQTFQSLMYDIRQLHRDRVTDSVGDRNLTSRQKKLLRLFRGLSPRTSSAVTIGTNSYRLIEVVIDSDKLAELDEDFAGKYVIAGAWLPNGLQFGQEFKVTIDPPQDGDIAVRERMEVTGKPVYPLHPKLIDFMPDDVEYDSNGTEKSSKRPDKLKQVHKYLGWADRRWT